MNRDPRPEDRRQFGRIHFQTPIPARVADARVNLVDLALNGARVVSPSRFTPAANVELKFESGRGEVDVMCDVVRCTLAQFAKAPGEKSLYQTGLRIVETIGESDCVMREMIAVHVVAALEEQKANAHGIPPIQSLINANPKSDRYRKCELVDGKWRKAETGVPAQPMEGFTVSIDVPIRYVEVLCDAYEHSDDEGRQLTKTLAQLSVTRGEGVPTRRYIP